MVIPASLPACRRCKYNRYGACIYNHERDRDMPLCAEIHIDALIHDPDRNRMEVEP